MGEVDRSPPFFLSNGVKNGWPSGGAKVLSPMPTGGGGKRPRVVPFGISGRLGIAAGDDPRPPNRWGEH